MNDTSLAEARHLASLGVYSNLELLKIWTETTPRALYPGRPIGELRDGYEASFLALEGNPLDDFENVGRIRPHFKQGAARVTAPGRPCTGGRFSLTTSLLPSKQRLSGAPSPGPRSFRFAFT